VAGATWRAVLFDVEGVIARADVARADRELRRRWPALTSDRVHRVRNTPTMYALWEEYSCGRVDPDTYWAAVLTALELPATPEAVAAMRAVRAATAWSVLDDAVLAIARRLRDDRGLRLGILSNSAPDDEPQIARFEHLFDCPCFSHRTGLRKPDPAAYRAAARALVARPEAVAFIDDKSRNLDAAAAVGMHPVAFRDAASLDADLVALGVLADPA
jgi:putative hydrolase of the HAD superfamily